MGINMAIVPYRCRSSEPLATEDAIAFAAVMLLIVVGACWALWMLCRTK